VCRWLLTQIVRADKSRRVGPRSRRIFNHINHTIILPGGSRGGEKPQRSSKVPIASPIANTTAPQRCSDTVRRRRDTAKWTSALVSLSAAALKAAQRHS